MIHFVTVKPLLCVKHFYFAIICILFTFVVTPTFAGIVKFTEDTTISNAVTGDSYQFNGDNLTLTIDPAGSVTGYDEVSDYSAAIAVVNVDNWTINNSSSVVMDRDAYGDLLFIQNASGTLNLNDDGSIILRHNDNVSHAIGIDGESSDHVTITTSALSRIANELERNDADTEAKDASAILIKNDVNVDISNTGTISGPTAIMVQDDANVTINNTGTIETTFGDNIYYLGTGSEKLDRRYAFKGGDGISRITNSGTMNGTIDLGSHGSSFLTTNGGAITGNVLIGNSTQEVTLNGGTYAGSIGGKTARAGIVNIGGNFSLTGASELGSTDDGTIYDDVKYGIDTVNLLTGSNLTFAGSSNMTTLNINSQATLNIASDSMSAVQTNVSGTMNFGDVNRSYSSNVTGMGTGRFDFGRGSHTLDGNLDINDGDTIAVTFTNDGSVGNLSTTGKASTESGSAIDVTLAKNRDYLVVGSKYKILDSKTGTDVNKVDDDNITINGNNQSGFSIIQFTNNVYDTNDLYLEVGRLAANDATYSPNAQAVYRNIGVIGENSSGKLLEFQNAIDASTSRQQATADLKSAHAQSDNGARQGIVNVLNSSTQAIQGRLDSIRDRSASSLSSRGLSSRSNDHGGNSQAFSSRSNDRGGNYNNDFSSRSGNKGGAYNHDYSSKSHGGSDGYNHKINKGQNSLEGYQDDVDQKYAALAKDRNAQKESDQNTQSEASLKSDSIVEPCDTSNAYMRYYLKKGKHSSLVSHNLNEKKKIYARKILLRAGTKGRCKDKKPSASYRVAQVKSYKRDNPIGSKNTNIWMQGYDGSARQKNMRGHDGEGYDSKTSGIIVGVDKEYNKNNYVGMAFNYSNSYIKSSERSKRTKIDSYQLNAYSSHFNGNKFLDTIFAVMWNEYQARRSIYNVNAVANGSYQGQTYAAKVRVGVVNRFNNGYNIIPEASLIYAHNRTDQYTEEGAGTLNLVVGNNSFNFLEARAGVNIHKNIITSNYVLKPQIKASYGYDFLGDRQHIDSHFVGQSPAFVTTVTKYDPSSYRLEGEIELHDLKSITLTLAHQLELRKRYKSHTTTLRGAYQF